MKVFRLLFIAAFSLGCVIPVEMARADEGGETAAEPTLSTVPLEEDSQLVRRDFFSVPEPAVMVFSILGFIGLLRMRNR